MKVVARGPRRAFALAAVLSLTALSLVASGSAAPAPESADTEGLVGPVWTPVGLRGGETTVVLQLSGNPVALVQAEKGRKLSKSEKNAVKSQLKAAQDGLNGGIAKLGGSVLAQYQFAYNGIKVRIDRSNLADLAALPGVTAVRGLQLMEPDNVRGVPFIGAPAVWDGLAGFRGEGIKVAVIDTGIDYTHANFGGPGTETAFKAADAADTLPPNAAFGWGMRVKGGIDLVGDAYDASADAGSPALIPKPDPNPLDCNGHGSHVAGTTGGSGVLSTGATYNGPYNASTISSNSWTIGPGVAPKVDLYAVRVFGCLGSTNETVDAIEWAVENDMDVINMSLGSSFGSTNDPSAVATTNAAKAGVVVVTSSGNSGASQYITGSPGTAAGAISTAAVDSTETFPGVNITAGTLTIQGINANEHPNPTVSGTLKVIKDDPATPVNEAEGCSVAAFGTLPANTIAVVNRGTCARVAKAIFGQQAGAVAVIMVNNDVVFPPLEGPITSNPDDGVPFKVTIPFIGVKGPATTATSDGAKLRALPDGTATSMVPAALTNPAFKAFAGFSSSGPRTGDSGLKPDISGPGVSIVSTGVGTGNKAATISGTSMASPHVAGVAALTRQAHPTFTVEDIKASIVNTGDPAGVVGYRTSRGGTGLVQPQKSTTTQVVARASGDQFAVSVNFGYTELLADYTQTREITLKNYGGSAASFSVAQANATTSTAHSVLLSAPSVTVPANGTATVNVTLNVPVAGVGGSTNAGLAFREVAGLVAFTPASGSNNGVTLRVPYYLVPRSLSKVDVALGSTSIANEVDSKIATTATVTNPGGARAGEADFYAWGLADGNEAGNATNDVRAVGVQSFAASDVVGPAAALPGERFLVFAVNTYDRWSNASANEYDIAVDVDRDKKADYIVVGADQGAVQTGTFNGRMGAFVFSTRSAGATLLFLASDPTDSSTVEIGILSRQLCRAGEPCLTANKNITYSATSFDLVDGGVDAVEGSATYDAFNPVVGEGGFANVAPGGSATVPLTISVPGFRSTKPLGLMVVSRDNAAGVAEAKLLPIDLK
jgi:minor extracellular serine protease Vpr